MPAPIITHGLKVIGGSMIGGIIALMSGSFFVGVLVGALVVYMIMKPRLEANPQISYA